MKSVIICEGSTDLVLIQYFMEKVNSWVLKNDRINERRLERSGLFGFQYLHNFIKNNNELIIGDTGGSTNIVNSFAKVIERNKQSSSINDVFDNIVIICDRDEKNVVSEFDMRIVSCLTETDVATSDIIDNDVWAHCTLINARGNYTKFRVLLLVIPFEETGALETFLLNALSDNDEYDRQLIDECNGFVDSVDPEKRYLCKRRYKTKAKFDVYFSVRTPLEQYRERRNILRGIPWEEYENIQNSFRKLRELG